MAKDDGNDVLLQEIDRQDDRVLMYYLEQVSKRAMPLHYLAQRRLPRENGGRDIVNSLFYCVLRQLEQLERILLAIPEEEKHEQRSSLD